MTHLFNSGRGCGPSLGSLALASVRHAPAIFRNNVALSLGRLNKKTTRRTRAATLFPNEASLLRLASAVLSEISDDWKTERAYPNMEAR